MLSSPFTTEIAFSVIDASSARGLIPLGAEREIIAVEAHPKRHASFTAGRAAAREALQQLGGPPAPILRGSLGEPVWPAGYIGSVAHSGDVAVAAVGSAAVFSAIGVDLDGLSRFDTTEIERRIAREAESGWLSQAEDSERRYLRAVLFVAKEAIYKAFSPLVGRRFGFDQAELEQPTLETARARLLFDVPGVIGAGEPFSVRITQGDGLIVAGVAIAR